MNWVYPIDLSEVHPQHTSPFQEWKYIRFTQTGFTYHLVDLSFGLAIAPQLFAMMVKEVNELSLGMGIHPNG